MKLDKIPDTDDVLYYRLYLSRENIPTVVTMQRFDEDDYDPHRFLTTDRFTEEEEAIDAVLPFRQAWSKGLNRLIRYDCGQVVPVDGKGLVSVGDVIWVLHMGCYLKIGEVLRVTGDTSPMSACHLP